VAFSPSSGPRLFFGRARAHTLRSLLIGVETFSFFPCALHCVYERASSVEMRFMKSVPTAISFGGISVLPHTNNKVENSLALSQKRQEVSFVS